MVRKGLSPAAEVDRRPQEAHPLRADRHDRRRVHQGRRSSPPRRRSTRARRRSCSSSSSPKRATSRSTTSRSSAPRPRPSPRLRPDRRPDRHERAVRRRLPEGQQAPPRRQQGDQEAARERHDRQADEEVADVRRVEAPSSKPARCFESPAMAGSAGRSMLAHLRAGACSTTRSSRSSSARSTSDVRCRTSGTGSARTSS